MNEQELVSFLALVSVTMSALLISTRQHPWRVVLLLYILLPLVIVEWWAGALTPKPTPVLSSVATPVSSSVAASAVP